MFEKVWNEANTFSKLIYPYLQNTLSYPERSSEFFDEQTWVRKRGDKKGPYDGVFLDKSGVLVLVEAKKENAPLGNKELSQLFDYALGESFNPLPPPFALLSNGVKHIWFRRRSNCDGTFSYNQCDPVPWKETLKARRGGLLTEELSMKRTTRLLEKIRVIIFDDLREKYFPENFLIDSSKLGPKKKKYELIFNTRRSFVDPLLSNLDEDKISRAVLSSIALSLTLKVLFVKIQVDLKTDPFPADIRTSIKKLAHDYPGILIAEPYDVLEISDKCADKLYEMLSSVRFSQAFVFESEHNPIGDVWDALVETEEHDLQVKSLGNVYTPHTIVKAMVDAAENVLGNWKEKNILEPACGSGHFVREIYPRMLASYLGKKGDTEKVVNAHKNVLKHIRAIDIDAFATQTTQLGMFLEVYRQPKVWEQLAPKGKLDLSEVVIMDDSLMGGLFDTLTGFKPDLVIGNPPYGVSVTESLKKQYNLGSPDSYGCFIARSLDLLKTAGYLVFVVSSTFLTAKTHQELRKKIYENCKIKSIHLVHRNAFPGRDVFCALVIFQKDKKCERTDHSYIFTDAWPIHPNDNDFEESLKVWITQAGSKLPSARLGRYIIPQSLSELRIFPPHPNVIEENLDDNLFVSRDLLGADEVVYPFFGGLPSLYLFCSDKTMPGRIRSCRVNFPGIGTIDGVEVNRGKKWVPIIKLWQIAEVRQGLATADDEFFIRKTPGVIPNARRRNIKDVDLRCTISADELDEIEDNWKTNGIPVVDPHRDRYFVPYDKGGEQDTEKGALRSFWSPIDYWIDWSEAAVTELKRRNAWKPGTPKKPRFQNSQHYFKKGIRFSRAGLYAPMFELSFGGVFSDKGSLILPFSPEIVEYILLILCSPITRYLTKNFLQHTVMTEVDIIRQIPIIIPTPKQKTDIDKICNRILRKKEKNQNADTEMNQAWSYLFKIYGIPKEDQKELETWFRRRYPHFGSANHQKTTS